MFKELGQSKLNSFFVKELHNLKKTNVPKFGFTLDCLGLSE